MKKPTESKFKFSSPTSNRKPSAPKLKHRPPSTFGRDNDKNNENDNGENGENGKINLQKMNMIDQRKVSKKYLEEKLKEIKHKYRS